MDRRKVLAGLGAVAAASSARAQPAPVWSSPVIDMHFHMRKTPEANIAHQRGAGITAANLLSRYDPTVALTPQQAKSSPMFPCWFAATDVARPDAEQILTQAVKAGAKGFGELKYPVAADGRRCAGSMTWRRN